MNSVTFNKFLTPLGYLAVIGLVGGLALTVWQVSRPQTSAVPRASEKYPRYQMSDVVVTRSGTAVKIAAQVCRKGAFSSGTNEVALFALESGGYGVVAAGTVRTYTPFNQRVCDQRGPEEFIVQVTKGEDWFNDGCSNEKVDLQIRLDGARDVRYADVNLGDACDGSPSATATPTITPTPGACPTITQGCTPGRLQVDAVTASTVTLSWSAPDCNFDRYVLDVVDLTLPANNDIVCTRRVVAADATSVTCDLALHKTENMNGNQWVNNRTYNLNLRAAKWGDGCWSDEFEYTQFSYTNASPTPAVTPTATPEATRAPLPNQPAVCNDPGYCSQPDPIALAPPQVSYESGRVYFSWNQVPNASKYTLRWAPVGTNEPSTECCALDVCTGETFCGNRATNCRGAEKVGFSLNCDGNTCQGYRDGIEYCRDYFAEINAENNVPGICSPQTQRSSNQVIFKVPGANCPGGGGGGPQPTTPTPSPNPTNCALGSGFCAPDYLEDFFYTPRVPDDKSKTTKAREASQICQRESSSNPNAINAQCLHPDDPFRDKYDTIGSTDVSKDFSVGLFQANLLNLCQEGLEFRLDGYVAEDGQRYYCKVKEEEALDACVAQWQDPDTNIRWMVSLSNNGVDWTGGRWGGACACGLADCAEGALNSVANVNQDGYVDAADVSRVMSLYGTQLGEADYDQTVDFCGPQGDGADGQINAYEISCLIRDWNPRR